MVLLVLLNLKLNMYYSIVRKSSIRIPLNSYASLETQEFSSPHTSLYRYPNKKQYLMSRRVSMGRAFSKCYTSCNHYFCFADGRTETCFPGGARGKDSPLDREGPLEDGKATHSSLLAWRIPRTEQPGGLQSTGLQRVGHDWSDLAHTHTLRRGEESTSKSRSKSSTHLELPGPRPLCVKGFKAR